MHYLGDIREVAHLAQWETAYFFPNCFQQLRGDELSLPYKMADGRAFWGLAMVVWCICFGHAEVVVVEQPDTVLPDFLDVRTLPQTRVEEFRTSQYGDEQDKFVRLTCRRGRLPPTRHPIQRRQEVRGPARYRDSDHRDRERSTWARFPGTCAAVAGISPMGLPGERIALQYDRVIAMLAAAWAAAQLIVPYDFANPDGRPTLPEKIENTKRSVASETAASQNKHPSSAVDWLNRHPLWQSR